MLDNPAISTLKFSDTIDRNQGINVFPENLKETKYFDYYMDQDSIIHIK